LSLNIEALTAWPWRIQGVLPVFLKPGKESVRDPGSLKDPTGKSKIEINNYFIDGLNPGAY